MKRKKNDSGFVTTNEDQIVVYSIEELCNVYKTEPICIGFEPTPGTIRFFMEYETRFAPAVIRLGMTPIQPLVIISLLDEPRSRDRRFDINKSIDCVEGMIDEEEVMLAMIGQLAPVKELYQRAKQIREKRSERVNYNRGNLNRGLMKAMHCGVDGAGIREIPNPPGIYLD